jgi:hypothetical protein
VADLAYGKVYVMTRDKARLQFVTTYQQTGSISETARSTSQDSARPDARLTSICHRTSRHARIDNQRAPKYHTQGLRRFTGSGRESWRAN